MSLHGHQRACASLRHGAAACLTLGILMLLSACGGSESASMPRGNQSPIADAGPHQQVHVGDTVRLDGRASSALPGRALVTFSWTQIAGPSVLLNDSETARPAFVAPVVAAETALVFRLTVTDDQGGDATAMVTITVFPQPPPQADAGADQIAVPGERVVLDGRGSSATDDSALAFSWAQQAGPSVALENADQALAQFVAPAVSVPTTLGFVLTVTDQRGAWDTAEVQVEVIPPPQCDDSMLCAGAARVRITPAQQHIDGIEEARLLGSSRLQQFNLGGFGFDMTQNFPEPFGTLGELLTEAAGARVHTNAAGRKEHTWMRAMVLSRRLPNGEDEQVVFLVMDAIGAGNVITNNLKARVSAATGIAPDNILFGQTHSHAGADLQGLWGGVPQDWIDKVLYPAAVQAVSDAQKTLCPAQLSVGQMQVPSLNNYRRPRVRTDAQADPTMTLLQARCVAGHDAGEVRGSLLQYNAHPVGIGAGLDPRVPHADYILGAVELLEREQGGVALYFNGPIADASTAGPAPGDDDYERVRSRGENIARQALMAPMRELAPTMSVRHEEVALPVTNPLFIGLGALGALNRYYDFLMLPLSEIPFLGEQIAFLPQIAPTASTIVSRLTLGGAETGLEIVTIPGEATNTFGTSIRALAQPGADMMFLGLTQQSFGYIIPENEFSYVDPEGGTGLLLPFTNYEEYVSLGPLTAPMLRLQGYNPLFDVGPLSPQGLPPNLLACYGSLASEDCVLADVGRQLGFIQGGLKTACEDNGLPQEFCNLLDPLSLLPGGEAEMMAGPGLSDVCQAYSVPGSDPLCDLLADAQAGLQQSCGLLGGGLLCALTSGNLHTLVNTCYAGLPDAFVENSPLPLCKTVDTFVQGAASFCRQTSALTGDALRNEVCSLISGVHINERQIAAFEDSWAARAVMLQNRLGLSLPWVHTQILATHNSFNATDENIPPTISGLDANQFYGVVDQLRMGVRGLELDVHWMPTLKDDTGLAGLISGLIGSLTGSTTPVPFAPVVCHGNVQHFGCTYERTLREELVLLRGWLDANPEEVIIIDLEANLDEPLDDTSVSFDRAADDFDAVLGDLIFRPGDHGATCEDAAAIADPASWLNVSRSQMLAAGARVIVYTGTCSDGVSESWASLFHRKRGSNHVQSARTSFEGYHYPECDFDRATHNTRWTRFYEDGTLVGAITGSPGLRVVDAMPEMLRCGVNMPSPDFLVPEHVVNFIWSWAPQQPPVAPGDDCAFQNAAGRFEAGQCATQRPYACVDENDPAHWQIAGPGGSWHQAECPAGFRFAVPANAYFNEQLREARLAAGNPDQVWLNYRRSDDDAARWQAEQ
ncbi:MAG: hypothetical protein LAT61_02910 [Alcanivorax sp.]|nr:hypothetical protein [Alcanivorax sp.]